jgi:hypothetical protein
VVTSKPRATCSTARYYPASYGASGAGIRTFTHLSQFGATIPRMSEPHEGRQNPEVGTLSPDRSRMWDGRFWVVVRADHPLDAPRFSSRQLARVQPSDRRGFNAGLMLLAGIVAAVLGSIHFTLAPSGGRLAAFPGEITVADLFWSVFTYVAVAVILSIGRQGIDVILLRSMVAAWIMGAALMAPVPIYVFSPAAWLLAVLVAAFIWSVTVGPLLAGLAILANLLWYRRFWSLRPQLGIFTRGAEES